MEKNELMEYLTAVCDAEGAAQSCRERIEELRQKKRLIKNIKAPSKPEYRVAKHFSNESTSNLLTTAFVGLFLVNILITLLVFATLQAILKNPALMWMFPAIYIIVSYIEYIYLRKRDIDRTAQYQKEEYRSVTRMNHQIDEEYALALYAYNRSKELHSNLLTSLDIGLNVQNKLLAEVTIRLNTLYNMNILHPSCRSLIAAYQIREYLEMGICETLEGPNGAYKQYQFDVLAQKVCTSIDDMKKSLSAAIYSLQSTLVRELRLINQSVQDMNTTLHSDFDRVNANIDLSSRHTREQIDAGFRDANAHLANISRNLSISAHNDYIEKRINNVDTYLLKAPEKVQ